MGLPACTTDCLSISRDSTSGAEAWGSDPQATSSGRGQGAPPHDGGAPLLERRLLPMTLAMLFQLGAHELRNRGRTWTDYTN